MKLSSDDPNWTSRFYCLLYIWKLCFNGIYESTFCFIVCFSHGVSRVNSILKISELNCHLLLWFVDHEARRRGFTVIIFNQFFSVVGFCSQLWLIFTFSGTSQDKRCLHSTWEEKLHWRRTGSWNASLNHVNFWKELQKDNKYSRS